MQGAAASPYSPTSAGGQLLPPYNPMTSPNTANSPRHAMPGMSPVAAGPGGATASYSAQPNGYPPAPHLDDTPLDPMDPSVAAYYGDMTDLEYEQSMMIMQQQLEMQQMQLRRMQQQRAMQRAQLTGQPGAGGHSPPGSAHRSGYELAPSQLSPNPASNNNSNHGGQPPRPGGLTRKAGNFPQGPTGYGAPPPQAPHNTRLPHQPPAKMTPPANASTTSAADPRGDLDANARKPKRTLSMTRPERTHSGLSALHMNSPDLPTTGDAQQDGELTLEEAFQMRAKERL